MATRRRIVIIMDLSSSEEVRLVAPTEGSVVRFPNFKKAHAREGRAYVVPPALLLVLIIVIAGCGTGGGTAGPDPGELPSTALATFEVDGERFRVFVERVQTIGDLYALQAGTGSRSIPSGPLLAGPGPEDFNLPWSWHMDPKLTVMTDLVDQGCDAGTPGQLEQDLAAWLAVGSYCPSNVILVGLVGNPH